MRTVVLNCCDRWYVFCSQLVVYEYATFFWRIWLSNREKHYQFASSWLLCCGSGRVICGDGRWCLPWKSWEGEKTVRQEDTVSRGNVPPLAKGEPFDRAGSGTCSEALLQMPRGDQEGWMQLEKPLRGGRTKPRPEEKNLSVRTQWAGGRFVYKPS